jgi:hypothetical protein
MGVLDGIRVLDLSWEVSGPVTGMLLAHHRDQPRAGRTGAALLQQGDGELVAAGHGRLRQMSLGIGA